MDKKPGIGWPILLLWMFFGGAFWAFVLSMAGSGLRSKVELFLWVMGVVLVGSILVVLVP